MNKHDEIKSLLNASRNMIYSNNESYNTDISKIKEKYGIIDEQKMKDIDTGDEISKRINVPTSVEAEIEFDVDKRDDKQQAYRVSGGVIIMHGKDKRETQLTSLEKNAFQDTMDEFINEVSDMVDFNNLNVYSDNVDWSGKLIEFDLDFMYRIGETNGVYVDSEMVKVDEEFDQLIHKLRQYYEKFKSKWAKILAQRKKTDPNSEKE